MFSELCKDDIPQMIQRLSELKRIDHGSAIAVVTVKPVDIIAFDQQCHNPAAVFTKPHFRQAAATTQKERSTEDVRGLKGASH